MSRPECTVVEGTPAQIGAHIRDLSSQKRYRLVELADRESPKSETAQPPPKAAATIALLESWIASAPTDPQAIREAEEDLRQLKGALNDTRDRAGARILFPQEKTR